MSLLRSVMAAVALGALIAGCSLDRNALAGPDAAVGDAVVGDAGVRDSAAGDAAFADAAALDAGDVDAYVPPGEDGGPPCTERCDGNIAITCPGGAREDCGAGARCMVDGSGARCEPLLCVPDARECSMDGRAALVCRDEGSGQDATPCERGCDGATDACRPETACPISGVVPVGDGDTVAFDTCPFGNDWSLEPGDPQCANAPADGADRIFRLNIDADGMYRIEVRDADAVRRVDPVVYLRTDCDDEGSQVACDDDVSTTDLTARLDTMLDAGDYFLVVDGFDYAVPMTDYTCGDVELVITRR